MGNKKCTKCKKIKNRKLFNKKETNHWCNHCYNNYTRKHYIKNKEKRLIQTAQYRKDNKQKMGDWQKEYYKRNVAVYKKKSKQYYKNNKNKIIEKSVQYNRIKRKICAIFQIKDLVRRRINESLQYTGAKKKHNTIKYLGCTWVELKEHLESQFVNGMSWKNRRLWHIDHIIPLALFDLADTQQQEVAFHVTNLQPLWAKDNLKKGGR